jgi:signal transduction histidine kinase/CheY-like chemotaxis protein/GAF domain-containing protein/HPt (histidine-containing phosphotransfer) domain-containing protein
MSKNLNHGPSASRDADKTIKVLFKISNAVNNTGNLNALYREIHTSLGEILNVDNFAIAIHHKDRDAITFPYFVDEKDQHLDEINNVSEKELSTAKVITRNKALLLTEDKIQQIYKKSPESTVGTPCKVWVGVPLRVKNKVMGAIILQNYDSGDTYKESDFDILNSVSEFVAIAIERKQSEEEIRQTEQIANTLFAISNAITTTDNLNALFKSIYQSLNMLIKLPNFFIALVDKEKEQLYFPFFVDEKDSIETISIGIEKYKDTKSHTSQVILSKRPLFLTRQMLEQNRKKKKAIGTGAVIWLGIPLLIQDQVIGVMVVQHYSDPDYFTQKDMNLLTAVSDQIALAIDRKQSLEQSALNQRLTDTFFKISNAVNTTQDLSELYKSIHRSLHNVIDMTNFLIGLTNKNDSKINFAYYVDQFDNLQGQSIALGIGSIGNDVISSGKPVFLHGEAVEHRIKKTKAVGTSPKIWMGVPLKIDDKVIGYMAAQSYTDPDLFDHRDVEIFSAVSEQVAIAIDRKRAQEELRQNEKLTQTLFRISNAVNTTENLDDLYNSIYLSLNLLIDLPNFYICTVEEEKMLMHFPFYIDEEDADENLSFTVDYSDGSKYLTLEAIKSKRPIFLHEKDLEKKAKRGEMDGSTPKVWLGLPLIIRNKVTGVLAVQHYQDPDYFSQKDVDLLVAVSDQVALAIDRKKAQETILEREKQILELSAQTEEFSLAAASIITMKDEIRIFEYISQAIIEKSDYRRLIMSYFIDTPPYREILAYKGISEAEIEKVRDKAAPKSYYERIIEAGQKVGNFASYLPHTLSDVLGSDLPIFASNENPNPADEWHPDDMLFLPMNDENGNFIGVISVDDSKSGKRPTKESVRPLEIFSSLISQIIIVRKIQNELKDHKDNLEKKVADRTKELTTEIKERIEIERKLKRAKIQAEAGAQAKIEFLTNMSHEIRTPINGIMGMAELAMDHELSHELKKILETIDNEANQLLGIINEILDFSKIEAGKLSIENIEFDLRHTFEQTCGSLAMGLDDKGIDFFSFLAPDIPSRLIGDPGRLRQVLVNLTSNAIKFTTEGEIFIKGELVKESASTLTVRFIVKDTGIGIPENSINTIFDSFSQVDGSTTREYGGTGLGTTISKQLVELMGGKIGVESEENRGTTFWFTLPFRKQKDHTSIRQQDEAALKGLNVLVIDENQTNRYIFDQYLRSYGCSVILTKGPVEGLTVLSDSIENRSQHFDLIIENYKMTHFSGFDLAGKIRSIKELDHVPIILLTSMGIQGDANRCKSLGINGYLPKPVKRSELKKAILSVIGKTGKGIEKAGELVTRYSLSESPAKNFRVLLVEDYPTNQKIAMKYLQKAGYQVDLAANGFQAVHLFKQKQYNLVLMDIQMPEMDGYEATKRIRAYESGFAGIKVSGSPQSSDTAASVPIIAMTAHAIKGYKEKCLAAGMDDYLTKPIKRSIFLERIESWLTDRDAGPLNKDSSRAEKNSNGSHEQTAHLPERFDLPKALKEFENDEDFFFEVLEEFLENLDNQLALIGKAIGEDDAQTIQKESHAIKGGAANLTATRLSYTAHELEIIGKSGNLDQSQSLFDNLVAETEALKEMIQSIGDKTKPIHP